MSGGVRNEAAQRSRPRISIRDVAKRANVSIATVSRALNSGQEIHPETRDHIQQVARELGYVVSARGRGLVNGRTDSVGVIIGREYLPVFLDPFYGEVLGGIELELEARNLSLVLTSQERDDSLLDFAAGQRVDGLLVIGRDLPENTLVDMQGYLPVVLVDRRAEGLSTVNSEHRSACADITRYLISRGCTRLAFLAEDLGNPNFQERFLGFQDALQEAGLPLLPSWVQHAAPRQGGGYTALQQVLAAGQGVPDGVVGANDPVALEAVRALLDAGLSVPDQVQVAGFDGLPSRMHLMTLTTMHVDRQEMGRRAARLLLDFPSTPQHIELHPQFIKGGSSR